MKFHSVPRGLRAPTDGGGRGAPGAGAAGSRRGGPDYSSRRAAQGRPRCGCGPSCHRRRRRRRERARSCPTPGARPLRLLPQPRARIPGCGPAGPAPAERGSRGLPPGLGGGDAWPRSAQHPAARASPPAAPRRAGGCGLASPPVAVRRYRPVPGAAPGSGTPLPRSAPGMLPGGGRTPARCPARGSCLPALPRGSAARPRRRIPGGGSRPPQGDMIPRRGPGARRTEREEAAAPGPRSAALREL